MRIILCYGYYFQKETSPVCSLIRTGSSKTVLIVASVIGGVLLIVIVVLILVVCKQKDNMITERRRETHTASSNVYHDIPAVEMSDRAKLDDVYKLPRINLHKTVSEAETTMDSTHTAEYR